MYIIANIKLIMLGLLIIIIINIKDCVARKNRRNFKLKTILMEFESKSSNFHNNFDFNSMANSSKYNKKFKIENYMNYKDVYGIRYVEPTKKQNVINTMTNNYSQEDGSSNNYLESYQNNVAENHNTLAYTIPIRPTNFDIITFSNLTNIKKPLKETQQNFLDQGIYQNATISTVNDLSMSSTKNILQQKVNTPVYNHVMKPSGKLQHTFHTLAARIKKLLFPYLTIEEGKSANQLTSLGQLLNIFRIVKFDNLPCIAARKPLTQLVGTCYHETDCVRLGGQGVGSCAAGFGVCCVCKNTIS
jgi:hypothetical protein